MFAFQEECHLDTAVNGFAEVLAKKWHPVRSESHQEYPFFRFGRKVVENLINSPNRKRAVAGTAPDNVENTG